MLSETKLTGDSEKSLYRYTKKRAPTETAVSLVRCPFCRYSDKGENSQKERYSS